MWLPRSGSEGGLCSSGSYIVGLLPGTPKLQGFVIQSRVTFLVPSCVSSCGWTRVLSSLEMWLSYVFSCDFLLVPPWMHLTCFGRRFCLSGPRTFPQLT